MHDLVFYAALIWHLGLALALAVYTTRTKRLSDRLVGADAFVLVVVGGLALSALHRGEAGYLDMALVLAMLAFVQTVAASRIGEQRRTE